MLTKRWTIAAAICAFALAAVAMRAPATTRPTTQPRSARDAALAKVQAARDVVAALHVLESGGEPLTPSFVQMKLEWSRRMFVAETDAAETKQEKLAAANAWLERVRREDAILRPIHRGARTLPAAMISYDLADAEYALAKLSEP